MLAALHDRFASDARVTIVAHDLNDPLPALGLFHSVVPSFAIHHVPHDRKRHLCQEIFDLLTPSGVFSIWSMSLLRPLTFTMSP